MHKILRVIDKMDLRSCFSWCQYLDLESRVSEEGVSHLRQKKSFISWKTDSLKFSTPKKCRERETEYIQGSDGKIFELQGLEGQGVEYRSSADV